MRGNTLPKLNIWILAFGYFACYWPYSALTKAVSRGIYPGMESYAFPGREMGTGLPGAALLPVSVTTSLIGMLIFITVMGWWRYPKRRPVFGKMMPFPGRWTFMSGCMTATIIVTTTLAYTFNGVSIVFVMLLMRGGVLILGPLVDRITGRHVRWFSAVGMFLSLGALVVAFSERGGYTITLICAIDILAYLTAYFIRLRFMSKLAKSDDVAGNIRYFVEEQMTATPVTVFILIVLATINQGTLMNNLHYGFTRFPFESGIFLQTILIGIFSQGTGIFGSLIFLDKQENTFCIPVNRSSSILAGVFASYTLAIWLGRPTPSTHQLIGAGLILTAILFLSIPPLIKKRRTRSVAA